MCLLPRHRLHVLAARLQEAAFIVLAIVIVAARLSARLLQFPFHHAPFIAVKVVQLVVDLHHPLVIGSMFPYQSRPYSHLALVHPRLLPLPLRPHPQAPVLAAIGVTAVD